MKKLIILILLIVPNCVLALEITSPNYILYNLTDNQILEEKDSKEKIYIASLTKIATAIVAIENIDNIKETISITNEGLNGLIEANASVAGFKLGQKVTYEDLLYGLMLPSGADAAQTLAYQISGSNDNFVVKMNELVKKLELDSTNFTNTTGLHDENHYSSAYDISIILKYALSNPLFKEIFTSKKYLTSDKSITFENSFQKIINNNNLNNNYIIGGKTGFTSNAGYCFASLAINDTMEYFLITAGASSSPNHLNDAINVYDYIVENYKYIYIYRENDILSYIPTINATKHQYNILANDNLQIYADKNFDKNDITYEYNGLNELNPNLNKEKIGTLNILYKDNLIHSTDVFYDESLNYSLSGFLFTFYKEIIIGCTALILFIIIKSILNKKKRR